MSTNQITPSPDGDKGDKGKEDEQIAIFLVPHEPKYKFEIPNREESELMVDVRQDLVVSGGLGYAIFANSMNERSLVEVDGKKPNCLAVVKADNDLGSFTLGINFDVYKRLSHPARRELLKEQMLRIPYGHFSERATQLVGRYGKEIVERAGQIVLSQIINPAILAEEGVVLPVPEMWEFPRGLTMEEYCELLSDEGGGNMPMPVQMVVIDKVTNNATVIGGKVSDEQLKDLLEQLTDENGLTKIDSMPTQNESKGDLDSAVRNFVNRVDKSLKNHHTSLKQQGFMSGDASQYIESLFREAKVNWAIQLHGLHGRHISTKRVISKRRPSRRTRPMTLPNGKLYSPYKGRKHDRSVIALVIIDTSGSMQATELRCIDSELKSIKNKGAIVWTVQVDAGIAKEAEEYTGFESLTKFFGRGGTSFCPGFEYAENMTPRPDYIVYFTDGYGTAPKEPSDIDTLWVLTSTGMDVERFRENVCSWGSAVQIDVEDA